MIYIQKKKAPDSLTAYRKQAYAYFDGCNKEDIRECLLMEQGYLCAYCMRRIDRGHMKIEHWYPEDDLTESEKLEYGNMLGTCTGHIEGQRGKEDTCDTHKGNTIITVNPCNKNTLRKIKYRSSTGEIYSEDSEIQKDLNETLNLNSRGHRLPQNRKEKLGSVINELARRMPQGQWTKEKLRAFLEKYSKLDDEGKKTEYLGIIQWYLERRI